MIISDVLVKLAEPNRGDRGLLRAFASIVIDDAMVVRDLKIVSGTGGLFVAMPSRKVMDRCPDCGAKNHLEACWCSRCGFELDPRRATREQAGHAHLHADVCHPINARCRQLIQDAVLAEYHAELERSRQPEYASRYHDWHAPDDDAPRAA